MVTQTGKQIADAMVNYYLVMQYIYNNNKQTEGKISIQPSILSAMSETSLGEVSFRAGRDTLKLTTTNLYGFFGQTFPIVQLTISDFIEDLVRQLNFWKIAVHTQPKSLKSSSNGDELKLSAIIENKADMRRAIIEYRELCACIHANIMTIQRISKIRPLRGLVDIHLMTQIQWHNIAQTAISDSAFDDEDSMIGKNFASGIVSRDSDGQHFHTIVIPKEKLLVLYAHALANDEELVRLRTKCVGKADGVDGRIYGMNHPLVDSEYGNWHGD